KDLEPDNAIITAAANLAHVHRNVNMNEALKKDKAEYDLQALNDADNPGPSVTTLEPEKFPKDFQQRMGKRSSKSVTEILIGSKSRAAQEIERKLSGRVTMSFKDKPLRDVLNDLHVMHAVNIVPEKTALDEKLISLDQPMSMECEDIPLKSMLNLILRDAKLTYVIRDDVIQVTTEEHARGKLVQKVYQVTDLVTPHINADFRDQFQLKWGARASEMGPRGASSQNLQGAGVQPYNPYYGLNNSGQAVGTTNTSAGSVSMSQGYTTPQQMSERRSDSHDPNATTENELMELIKRSIAPNSWNDSGGPATLEYFPLTHTLVVNQTPDIQEQVQDLLSALRRLQDQE